ncbi:MAG TPA: hypothetical protein VEB66_09105 [Opitutaceae bacterium]|nr:hypothetical protein [Opitutaceae bacterium]
MPRAGAADVGVAMGTGTDVAMHSAGLVLGKCDLAALGRARRLSRATPRNIRQNLFWAFAYNVAGLPLAASVFFPFTGWLLNPMFASVTMIRSSITVVLNALRLRHAQLTGPKDVPAGTSPRPGHACSPLRPPAPGSGKRLIHNAAPGRGTSPLPPTSNAV